MTPRTLGTSNRCAFCLRRQCYAPITGPGFDEVACREHGRALEILADALLPGVKKMHVSTSCGELARMVTLDAVAAALTEAGRRA